MPDDLFINTIRGTFVPKPTGRNMLILGENGAISNSLKSELEENGHTVKVLKEPTIEDLTEERLSGIEVVFLLAYDLEPMDVHVGDMEFINKLIDLSLSENIKRLVFFRSISEVTSGHPLDRDMYTRAETKLTESSLPITVVRSSMLLGVKLMLTKALNKYASLGRFPTNNKEEAKRNECSPLLFEEAMKLLSHTPEHEFERTYHFDLGGDTAVSYQDLLDLFIEKEKDKKKALGISKISSESPVTETEKSIWQLFSEKMHYSMLPQNNTIKDLFKKVKITPLTETIKKV